MANYLTSSTLIESVKNRALIPDNQVTFQDEDFLRFANEEMIIGLVPSILMYHEDYLLRVDEVPLEANESIYPIPYRAVGNKLRDLSYKDTNGNIYEMSRILIEDVTEFQYSNTINSVQHYYVQNNEIVLLPEVNGQVTGSLMFSYYLRPNELVEEDKVATIQSINTLTGEIFVDLVPEDFSNTDPMDFIQGRTPFKTLEFDITPTSVNSSTNTITFAIGDLPSRLAVGDMIALATETKIPQVPADLHVILAHRVAIRCLEALGDTQGLQNAMEKLKEIEFKTNMLIDNRVEGSPIKIATRWTPMKLSGMRRRNWGR